MKFKVTATIPIELEIDCQSKEEALDTATTILQEQRDDGDYASIVADCIESALVSGSITMTAVDNHEALVNELRTKRKISIQDMDAFLGYEIDKNDDMMFDDDYINVNLWMMDVDKALGLDVCTSDNDEYVTISVNWYPKAAEHPNKREIDIFVIYAETYGDDFDMELEMDDAEYATVLADFKKKFKSSTEKMVHATAIGLGSMSDRFRLLWKQSMRRKIRLFSVCRSATVPSNRCSICTTTLVWIWNPIISAVPSGTTRIE